MAKDIRKFVNRKFIGTVDLDLLERLLDSYRGNLSLDLDALPVDQKQRREALFEFFRNADETLPWQLSDALHCIMVLSNPNGVRILQEQADRSGVVLIGNEETEGEDDGRHLTPRHIALRAYLDHRTLFERALDLLAFVAPPSPMEFVGADEGVEPDLSDKAREAFREAASAYFSRRYMGRYCDVRWYTDEGEVDILVLHGKNMMTQLVEQEGEERVLSFREIRQDTIRYDPKSGRLKTSAQYAPEKKKLASLFAEHLLGRPEFFDGEDSQNLYTLRPINEKGAAFEFKTDWDGQLERLRVAEIQVDEGEIAEAGRKRYPRWAMTVKDNRNAVARLVEIAPDLNIKTARINYLKVEFTFRLDGKSRRIMVKVKPSGLVSFRRDAFESRIMEHLRRNGLCLPRRPDTAAVAAE